MSIAFSRELTFLRCLFLRRSYFVSFVLAGEAKQPVDPKARIHDKKPVKVVLEAGKLYSWCTCGYSKKQPFCDGAHKTLTDGDQKPIFRPHKFQVDEEREFALCNCKQTKNRPFCDGMHKEKWIQDANGPPLS